MSFQEVYDQFFRDLSLTKWYEYLAVVAGIVSVWYSKRESVLVYPVGLINTIIYIYISFKGQLPGEATVNFYYTVMSITGWYMWAKKDSVHKKVLHITASSAKDRLHHILFFLFFYTVIFLALNYFKSVFFEGAIPWADAFASAAAFTGMWLMTKKKVESWYWWIATNIASVPLFFVKHYVLTGLYYMILLIMAVFGLMAWRKKLSIQKGLTNLKSTYE